MGFIGNLFANIIGIIGGAILAVVVTIFQALSYVMPTQMATAALWLTSFIHIGDGFIPISDVILAYIVILSVWKFKYALSIFLHTIFPFIPIVGKKVNLPDHQNKTT